LKKKIKILWAEDEPRFVDALFEEDEFRELEISYTTVCSFEELKEEILNNYNEYFGVILDHSFYVNKDDRTADPEAWSKAKSFLKDFRKRKFELFTITGQSSKVEKIEGNQSLGLSEDDGYWAKKTDTPAIFNLLKKLKNSAKNINQYTYPNIFELSKKNKLGLISGKDREYEITINKIFEIIQNEPDSQTIFMPARKILEMVLDKLYELKFYPYEGSDNSPTMIKFLLGHNKSMFLNYKYNKPIIWFLMNTLKNLCDDGAHNKSSMPLLLDQYIKGEQTENINNACRNINSIVFHILIEILKYVNKEIDFQDETQKWIHIHQNKEFEVHIDQIKDGTVVFTEIQKRKESSFWLNRSAHGRVPESKLIDYLKKSNIHEKPKIGDKLIFIYSNYSVKDLWVTKAKK
tara:strand:- start:4776 stop:5990 length:1215 start_codon:yes stop_codon:yes gene_type:complete